MAEKAHPTDLLETVEKDQNEICRTVQTGGGTPKGMGVGEHEKILLADSQQLDPCHDPDKRLSS